MIANHRSLLIGNSLWPRYDEGMRHRRLLISLFVLTTLLVDLVVAVSGISDTVLWALYSSQVSLMGIWLAIGRIAVPVRVMVAFLVLIEWDAVVFLFRPEDPFPIVLSGMIVAAVAIPLLVVRLFGLQLVDFQCGSTSRPGQLEPKRCQFSLLYLFGLTTATALILGTLKYVFTEDAIQFRTLKYVFTEDAIQFQRVCLLSEPVAQAQAAAFGLVALAAVNVVLGRESFLWRLLRSRAARLIGLGLAAAATYHLTLLTVTYCTIGCPNIRHVLRDCFTFVFYERSLGNIATPYSVPYCFLKENLCILVNTFVLDAIPLLASLFVFRLAGYRVIFRYVDAVEHLSSQAAVREDCREQA
jgi:hypothetical protein